MESLQDILGNRKFTAPDEMTDVKNYVFRRYKRPCKVKIERGALIISVQSSALAATIHLERQQLIKACHITKKLVVRTG